MAHSIGGCSIIILQLFRVGNQFAFSHFILQSRLIIMCLVVKMDLCLMNGQIENEKLFLDREDNFQWGIRLEAIVPS